MSCTEIPRKEIHWEALELVEFSRKYLGMLFIDSSAVTYCGKNKGRSSFLSYLFVPASNPQTTIPMKISLKNKTPNESVVPRMLGLKKTLTDLGSTFRVWYTSETPEFSEN